MLEKPKSITDDMKYFRGGYGLEFKLASSEVFAQYSFSIEDLRRRAINLRQGQKFLIDISRFEYVEGETDLTGFLGPIAV